MRTQWPLVGRAEELDLLERTLTASRHRGVVLSGPAGVGKTRLGAELLDRARRAGWHTLRVSATRSMATVAFGALIHLLPVGGDAVESTLELMRRLRDELARLGRDRPVLLFVDDAHTLDEASAGTAHMLAATGTAFVVVAVRSREPVPDAVAALWKDDLAPRLELRPLSRGEAGELVRAALGGQVDGVTDHRLWHTTRGNALYLSELVRALLDSGHLAERGGVWSWTGDIALGDRLTELIEARLAGLAAEERTLLEVLALGEPLEPALLARVAGQPVESLAALEERGLVSVGDDGVRLGHPLHGEILRPTIGTLRRRSLYGALADAPTADGRRPGDLIRLATWRLEAGGRLDAPTLVAAARQARALFDHRLAERFARCAVTVGGDTDAYPLLADAAATNRAGGLAARCEGATTPVLRDAARVPAVGALTAREREIAELVALGLSNKDVARRLVVSVRTVGNHLNHVYGKLGVGRADLPALLNVHSGQSELGTPPGSAGTLIRLAEAKPAVPLDRPADTG